MQIHEVTKASRTDEGILDSVKSAVNSAKTGVGKAVTATTNAVGKAKAAYDAAGDRAQEKMWNKNQDKINAQAQKAAAVLARKGFNVAQGTPAKAQTPTNIKAAAAEKVAVLQKKFDDEFELGGGAPMAQKGEQIKVTMNGGTYTKGSDHKWRIGNQVITNPDSIKALDAQADTPYQVNPGAAAKYAQQNAAKANPKVATNQPDTQYQINPAAAKKYLQQKSQAARSVKEEWELFKEGALAQRSQQRNAGVNSVAPQQKPGVQPVQPVQAANVQQQAKAHTGGKVPGQISQTPNAVRQRAARAAKSSNAIKSKFIPWIKTQIPGLDAAYKDQTTKDKLDQAFGEMLKAKDKASIDAAFNQYATLAINAASQAGGHHNQSNSSQDNGFDPSLYASGIDSTLVNKLKTLLQQNHEKPPPPTTSSQTVNKLLKAVEK